MKHARRWKLSAAQRADMWRRWKAGQSLHEIGRALSKDHVVIHFLLARHGGIVPAARRRSRRDLRRISDPKLVLISTEYSLEPLRIVRSGPNDDTSQEMMRNLEETVGWAPGVTLRAHRQRIGRTSQVQVSSSAS